MGRVLAGVSLLRLCGVSDKLDLLPKDSARMAENRCIDSISKFRIIQMTFPFVILEFSELS
jgi:hypothetical protein